jgi:hypothetical protein
MAGVTGLHGWRLECEATSSCGTGEMEARIQLETLSPVASHDLLNEARYAGLIEALGAGCWRGGEVVEDRGR